MTSSANVSLDLSLDSWWIYSGCSSSGVVGDLGIFPLAWPIEMMDEGRRRRDVGPELKMEESGAQVGLEYPLNDCWSRQGKGVLLVSLL